MNATDIETFYRTAKYEEELNMARSDTMDKGGTFDREAPPRVWFTNSWGVSRADERHLRSNRAVLVADGTPGARVIYNPKAAQTSRATSWSIAGVLITIILGLFALYAWINPL